MACAGLTVYGPMHRFGVKKGTKMGVAGLGGLGHFAVLFGAALGAEVVVYTHQEDKVADAYKMGAADVVLTSEKDWDKKHCAFHLPLDPDHNTSALLARPTRVHGGKEDVRLPNESLT